MILKETAAIVGRDREKFRNNTCEKCRRFCLLLITELARTSDESLAQNEVHEIPFCLYRIVLSAAEEIYFGEKDGGPCCRISMVRMINLIN